MKNKAFKFYFVIFFCLSSILFFSPIFITISYLYYTYYLTFILVLLTVLSKYSSLKSNRFSTAIFLLLIAIFISSFSATFSWKQGFIYSLKAISPYLSYILFFLLVVWKMPNEELEKIITALGILYIIIYIITYISYPVPVFGDIENVLSDRGFERFRVDGKGFLFLFSFYSLGRFLINKKKWWLIVYLVSMVFVIMTLTRSLIIASFLISVLFILRNSSITKKIISVLFICSFSYFITQMNFFQILMEQTQEQSENVSEDVRVQAAGYFLSDFSPDIFSKIFGNGEPSVKTSYSSFTTNLTEDEGFYQSDVGYIGLYSKFGILAIIAYIILIYKTFKISTTNKYMYVKYFLYFIFISSIIIDAPFNTNYIPAICFAFYILSTERLHDSYKKLENIYNSLPSNNAAMNPSILR